jgi:hypothetical protein
MRRKLVALITAATLLAAPAAIAAPTCQDVTGYTIRCNTPGAMPVGWTLPRSERDQPNPIELNQFLKLVCALGIYFSLLAMLPEFERWAEEERN